MMLLNEKYLKQTLILCFAWTAACFLYYAVMLMLPSILARHSDFTSNSQYIFLIVISSVEVVSFYSAKLVMDHPDFGRKRSVYLGYGVMFILSSSLIIFGESNMLFLMVVFVGLKIFSTSCFMVTYNFI